MLIHGRRFDAWGSGQVEKAPLKWSSMNSSPKPPMMASRLFDSKEVIL